MVNLNPSSFGSPDPLPLPPLESTKRKREDFSATTQVYDSAYEDYLTQVSKNQKIQVNSQTLLLIFGDTYGKNSGMEGGVSIQNCNFLVACLEHLHIHLDIEHSELKKIQHLLQNSVLTKQNIFNFTSRIERNEEILIIGGWRGAPFGHTLLYHFIPQKDGKYTAKIINTGSGTEYHNTAAIFEKTRKAACFTIQNVSKERLATSTFFEYLNGFTNHSFHIITDVITSEDIYKFFTIVLNGEVHESNENKTWILPQESGTCSWTVFMAFLDTQLKNDRSAFEYRIKLLALAKAYTSYKQRIPQNRTPLDQENLIDATKYFSESLLKAEKKSLLTEEELWIASKLVRAILEEIPNTSPPPIPEIDFSFPQPVIPYKNDMSGLTPYQKIATYVPTPPNLDETTLNTQSLKESIDYICVLAKEQMSYIPFFEKLLSSILDISENKDSIPISEIPFWISYLKLLTTTISHFRIADYTHLLGLSYLTTFSADLVRHYMESNEGCKDLFKLFRLEIFLPAGNYFDHEIPLVIEGDLNRTLLKKIRLASDKQILKTPIFKLNHDPQSETLLFTIFNDKATDSFIQFTDLYLNLSNLPTYSSWRNYLDIYQKKLYFPICFWDVFEMQLIELYSTSHRSLTPSVFQSYTNAISFSFENPETKKKLTGEAHAITNFFLLRCAKEENTGLIFNLHQRFHHPSWMTRQESEEIKTLAKLRFLRITKLFSFLNNHAHLLQNESFCKAIFLLLFEYDPKREQSYLQAELSQPNGVQTLKNLKNLLEEYAAYCLQSENYRKFSWVLEIQKNVNRYVSKDLSIDVASKYYEEKPQKDSKAYPFWLCKKINIDLYYKKPFSEIVHTYILNCLINIVEKNPQNTLDIQNIARDRKDEIEAFFTNLSKEALINIIQECLKFAKIHFDFTLELPTLQIADVHLNLLTGQITTNQTCRLSITGYMESLEGFQTLFGMEKHLSFLFKNGMAYENNSSICLYTNPHEEIVFTLKYEKLLSRIVQNTEQNYTDRIESLLEAEQINLNGFTFEYFDYSILKDSLVSVEKYTLFNHLFRNQFTFFMRSEYEKWITFINETAYVFILQKDTKEIFLGIVTNQTQRLINVIDESELCTPDEKFVQNAKSKLLNIELDKFILYLKNAKTGISYFVLPRYDLKMPVLRTGKESVLKLSPHENYFLELDTDWPVKGFKGCLCFENPLENQLVLFPGGGVYERQKNVGSNNIIGFIHRCKFRPNGSYQEKHATYRLIKNYEDCSNVHVSISRGFQGSTTALIILFSVNLQHAQFSDALYYLKKISYINSLTSLDKKDLFTFLNNLSIYHNLSANHYAIFCHAALLLSEKFPENKLNNLSLIYEKYIRSYNRILPELRLSKRDEKSLYTLAANKYSPIPGRHVCRLNGNRIQAMETNKSLYPLSEYKHQSMQYIKDLDYQHELPKRVEKNFQAVKRPPFKLSLLLADIIDRSYKAHLNQAQEEIVFLKTLLLSYNYNKNKSTETSKYELLIHFLLILLDTSPDNLEWKPKEKQIALSGNSRQRLSLYAKKTAQYSIKLHNTKHLWLSAPCNPLLWSEHGAFVEDESAPHHLHQEAGRVQKAIENTSVVNRDKKFHTTNFNSYSLRGLFEHFLDEVPNDAPLPLELPVPVGKEASVYGKLLRSLGDGARSYHSSQKKYRWKTSSSQHPLHIIESSLSDTLGQLSSEKAQIKKELVEYFRQARHPHLIADSAQSYIQLQLQQICTLNKKEPEFTLDSFFSWILSKQGQPTTPEEEKIIKLIQEYFDLETREILYERALEYAIDAIHEEDSLEDASVLNIKDRKLISLMHFEERKPLSSPFAETLLKYFQCLTHKVATDKQYACYSKVIENRSLVLQLGCGEGKTSFLMKLFILLELLNKEHQGAVFALFPAANFPVNRHDLINHLTPFNTRVLDFKIDRQKAATESNLLDAAKMIISSQSHREVIVTTPEDLQSFVSSYFEHLVDIIDNKSFMKSLSEKEQANKLLSTLERALEIKLNHSTAIMDEQQMGMRPFHQVSFGRRQMHFPDPWRWKMVIKLYDAFLLLGQEDYTTISPKLVDAVLTNLSYSIEQQDWMKEYVLCDKEKLNDAKRQSLIEKFQTLSTESQSQIKNLRLHIKIFMKLALSLPYLVKFGPSTNEETAIPYLMNLVPSLNSKFTNFEIMIHLTMLMYLRRGLSEDQLSAVLYGWIEQTSNKEESVVTDTLRDVLKEEPTPEKIKALLLSKTDLVFLDLSKQTTFIFTYLSEFLFPQLGEQLEQINSDAQDLASVFFNKVVGFSGTPTDELNCPIGMEMVHDSTAEGAVYTAFMDDQHVTLSTIDNVRPENVLKLFPQCCALLDPNAALGGFDNSVIAQNMIDFIHEDATSVVFYSTTSNIPQVMRRDYSINEYGKESDDPEQRVTYLDQAHCIAVDLVHPDNGEACILIDEGMTLSHLWQTIKRMRLFGEGQKIHLLFSPAIREHILKVTNAPELTKTVFITWCAKNQAQEIESSLLTTAMQQVRAIYRRCLLKSLIACTKKNHLSNNAKLEARKSLIDKYRGLIIDTLPEEPFENEALLRLDPEPDEVFETFVKKHETLYSKLLNQDEKNVLDQIYQRFKPLLAVQKKKEEGSALLHTQQQEQQQTSIAERETSNKIAQYQEYTVCPDSLLRSDVYPLLNSQSDIEDPSNRSVQFKFLPKKFFSMVNIRNIFGHHGLDLFKNLFISQNHMRLEGHSEARDGKRILYNWKMTTKTETSEFLNSVIRKISSFNYMLVVGETAVIVTENEAESIRERNLQKISENHISLYNRAGDLLATSIKPPSDNMLTKIPLLLAQMNYLNADGYYSDRVWPGMKKWVSLMPEHLQFIVTGNSLSRLRNTGMAAYGVNSLMLKRLVEEY